MVEGVGVGRWRVHAAACNGPVDVLVVVGDYIIPRPGVDGLTTVEEQKAGAEEQQRKERIALHFLRISSIAARISASEAPDTKASFGS